LQHVQILIDTEPSQVHQAIKSLEYEFDINKENQRISFKDQNGIPFEVLTCGVHEYAKNLLISTGSEEHIKQLEEIAEIQNLDSENEIYRSLGLAYIEPELRESGNVIEIGRASCR